MTGIICKERRKLSVNLPDSKLALQKYEAPSLTRAASAAKLSIMVFHC